MTTRKKRGRRRGPRKPVQPPEVLVDEGPTQEGAAVPLTIAALQQQQNELLMHLPPETRRRLRFLAKHWDIPELAALRMAIADSYQTALEDEP